jgi:hypothetical protein
MLRAQTCFKSNLMIYIYIMVCYIYLSYILIIFERNKHNNNLYEIPIKNIILKSKSYKTI